MHFSRLKTCCPEAGLDRIKINSIDILIFFNYPYSPCYGSKRINSIKAINVYGFKLRLSNQLIIFRSWRRGIESITSHLPLSRKKRGNKNTTIYANIPYRLLSKTTAAPNLNISNIGGLRPSTQPAKQCGIIKKKSLFSAPHTARPMSPQN